MKRPSALASIVSSRRNGVSMTSERQSTVRSITTKRLDRPCVWRCSTTLANSRCEVDEPISMPTVFSSTVSCAQI